MGGQYDLNGPFSDTSYHMFYQGLFYMAGKGEVRNLRWTWKMEWRRNLFEWERNQKLQDAYSGGSEGKGGSGGLLGVER